MQHIDRVNLEAKDYPHSAGLFYSYAIKVSNGSGVEATFRKALEIY
jgi:hypothetical protein